MAIHAAVVADRDGSPEVRDQVLLESAVAACQASAGGHSPYRDAADVAAAYLQFMVHNQPFTAANEATALAVCIVFLRLNGLVPAVDGPDWEALARAVAAGKLDQEAAATRLRSRFIRRHTRK